MPLMREVVFDWWEEKQKILYPFQQRRYNAFIDPYLLRFLGDEEISSLTHSRMDSYFAQLFFEQTYRNCTGCRKVKYGKSILKSIFDFAEAQGMAKDLPETELTFRINTKKPKSIEGCNYSTNTIEQLEKLMESKGATLTGLAFGFAWFAGLTREEILSVKWSHFDFANNMIRLEEGRQIWLEKPLRDMLLAFEYENQNSLNPNEYIYISQKKTRFAGPSLNLLVRKMKQEHGITDKEVNLKGLRNNYMLRKLQTISTEELPFLAKGVGISPISLLNKFAFLLIPEENYMVNNSSIG